MTRTNIPRGWMLVPPPLLFAVAFALGLVVQAWLPLLEAQEPYARGLRWLGIALLVVGAGLTFSSAALFARLRTTIVPHGRSSTLVTRGAYRWTRNPMYLGLSVAYLGASALSQSLWPLLFLPFVLAVLDRKVIPHEERQLAETFGADYYAYRARVGRWL